MLSLEKCAMILNDNMNKYNKDEIKMIREILYEFARIDEMIRTGDEGRKDSSDLHTSEYRRAS